ncbi:MULTISPECIES: ABC transporter transmembrane domain-containing protein [unclassified Hwanghaeella]|jgi:ATP-binding cassette subfamily B protein|uniref:ABC transporter transmembrane domain-containing protein n=1 Tax=unclassified Hwanghaeella TaxID=2605944 RepID=UPI003B67A790|tara:strand:+ start:135093 stop:136850 length:1758 start_codon:yes stop_codon:yes gene_type:complete
MKVLRRTLGFLKPYKKQVFYALTALAITAGSVLALGQGVRVLIDGGFSSGDPDALNKSLLALLGLSIVMAVGGYFRFYMVTWLGERVVADLRNAVFDRVLRLDPAFFEITKTGEILSRLTTDTALLQSIIGSSASMALRNALMLVGGIGMMVITNAKLTALVLLVVPIVVIPIMTIGRRVRVLSRHSQDRIADVGSFAEENLNAIRTVQAFTHEGVDRRRFGDEVRNAFDTAIQRTQLRGVLTAVVILLVFASIGVILWVGGNDVMQGAITGGELAAFVFYATVVAFSVGIISEVYGELQRAAGATERLVELLEAEPQIKPPASPIALPEPPQGRVVFDNVTFKYPSRPKSAALKNFSLTIEPGQSVALVGPSGAGKSTVFQLLLRFYDPQDGHILLDGVDLSQTDPQALRQRMALVPQDPVIFGTSGRENIRYGRPEAGDDDVMQAARDAAAHDFITALPEGYDTFLGEKGLRLSGGQKQRVSIARAVLRNPSVLLLDEATSALDSENERQVQTGLERLMQGRTTLIIAHRLATVINADRIAVIEEGRIVATGTHDELMTTSPLYKHLAELQFAKPILAGKEDA